MTARSQALRTDANAITSAFGLYFSLDDQNLRTNAPDFLSLITDTSLIAVACEVLPIVGHHLVERATDVVLDKTLATAVACKGKLLSLLRSQTAGTVAAERHDAATDTAAILELMAEALKQSDAAETAQALGAGQAAVATLVQQEFGPPGKKATEYAIAITREIKITVSKA